MSEYNIKKMLLRKSFRLLGLFFPIFYIYYPQAETVFITAIIAAIAVTIESMRFYSDKTRKITEKIFSPIAKVEEIQRVSGITYLILGALFTIILFPRIIAIPVLIISTLGDAISSLAASKWKKFKIFRNKSLEGVIVCLAVCLTVGWLLLHTRLVNQGLNSDIVITIVLLATIFDIIPLPLDDNISTPLAVGILTGLLS